MKKTLKTILILAMALVLCCNAAFATHVASSKTNVADFEGAVDKNGDDVELYACNEETVSLTTEEAAKVINAATGKEVKASDLTIVSNQCLHCDGEFPVKATFDVGGKVNLYVLHHNGSAWELVGSGESGKAVAEFKSLSPVALVTESNSTTKTGDKSGKSGKSYKTGEDSIVLAGCTVALAAGAVAILSRKKEA